jgi:hypothetical protein
MNLGYFEKGVDLRLDYGEIAVAAQLLDELSKVLKPRFRHQALPSTRLRSFWRLSVG